MMERLSLRQAEPSDATAIWSIIQPIIAKGDTYAFAPSSSKEEMLSYWMGIRKHTYVAEYDGKLVGTFVLQANQPGLGSHIANAGYMVDTAYGGLGIGKAMCLFSMKEAKRLGYVALQFNLVIKSNIRAIQLWKKLGFQVIGEIPEAFQHQELGLTNALIMYQKL
ncbi:MAG: GNAT family N-acetyltransferase [Flammeovirgaceae bacterium]